MRKGKFIHKSILFLFFFLQFGFLFFKYPQPVGSDALTTASITLGNSRLSYKAGVSGTPAAGQTTVDIDTSGNSDNDTDHLFPNDVFCFPDAGENGCSDNRTYTAQTITDTDTFTFTPSLVGALEATDYVVASASGAWTITFTTATEIPIDGYMVVTIPAKNANTVPCDGIPDHNSSIATNGFDLGKSGGPAGQIVAAGDVSVTAGCTPGNWDTTETITCGTSSTDHTIRIDRTTTTCAAGSAITISIDAAPGIINPAPITSGHTQGAADTYTVDVTTWDDDTVDVALDSVDIKVAPVEAVLVSTTVDETLSFTVSAVTTAATACGVNPDVDTTATSVPYSTLAATETFYDAAHDLQVSTNAQGGYAVTTVHTDQLGKDGGACTGDVGESSDCIQDTTCDGTTCTHLAAAVDDWETSTNNGFGFSLDSSDGTDAAWEWDGTSGTCDGAGSDFCAAQFADQEDSQAAVTVMSNANQVSSKNIYVCYRISVSDTQPAGYYQSIVRYTATATF